MSHTPQKINKAFNQKVKIMSPCYGCQDRTVEPNCHATGACERYEKFKAEYKAANKNENKQRKNWW